MRTGHPRAPYLGYPGITHHVGKLDPAAQDSAGLGLAPGLFWHAPKASPRAFPLNSPESVSRLSAIGGPASLVWVCRDCSTNPGQAHRAALATPMLSGS